MVIDLDTLLILFIEQAAGSVHDFALYKSSTGSAVSSDVKMKVDSSYQGIAEYHANSEVPFKKGKNRPWTSEEKAFNRRFVLQRNYNLFSQEKPFMSYMLRVSFS